MPTRRQVILGTIAALGLSAGGAATLGFRADMARARDRIADPRARLAETRFGPMEYVEAGEGPPVLFLHGTGGGFDQGLLFADPLLARGWRIVAPSRFGYLRTPLPDAAGREPEADAFVDLLDGLGIDRVAVAGGSAGAIPALAFAARHPDRCTACLPIVPALAIPGRDAVEPWSPAMERTVMRALGSDLLFWTAIRTAPRQVIATVLATDPALVDAASETERARVRAILHGLLPVSVRATGTLYDNRQTNRMQDIPFDAITAPTLAISCEDDRFLTAENARYLARAIPGAEAVIYPDGGHVWVGRNTALFDRVDAFLRSHGGG